jgi:hypothetical protein
MDNVWYHGRSVKATNFDYQYTGKGYDQQGSGFYFTNSKANALQYAENNGIVMTVKLHYQKLLPIKGKPKAKDLQFMILNAPDYESTLYNFGENLRGALIIALQMYSDMPPAEAMQTIENDFYRSHAPEYLINLSRLGYDGHIITGLHSVSTPSLIAHFIAYNPKIIEIVQIENAEDLRKI